ncbi:unnamed protein product [Cylicocyclus nassatus]|uniref:Uncharacterized protein n=1 Tax=Cylicocyclus nassatus TaxID=53992 RepID=A0AA36DMU4_CYLNA|nr:unnamed protein product [Cylicocyclus nassatus]
MQSVVLLSIIDLNVTPIMLLVTVILLSTILIVFECGKCCDKPQPSTRHVYIYGQAPTAAGNNVVREKAGIKEVSHSSPKKRTPSNRASDQSAKINTGRKTPILVSEKANKSGYHKSQKRSIYCEPTQIEAENTVKNGKAQKGEQRSPTLKEKKAPLLVRLKRSRMFKSKDAKKQAKIETEKKQPDKMSRKTCTTGEKSLGEDSDTLKGVTSIENEDEKSNNFANGPQADSHFGAK